MKKALLLISFFFGLMNLRGQERQVEGIVFDRDSKQRLARVYIYNLRTHKGFYNNSKGEFKTTAIKGDTLLAALQGYRVDTITVQSSNTIVFYLKRSSILLQEVSITDTLKNPKSRHRENQEAYKDIYRKGDGSDLIRIGGTNPASGAGLSIDALWSLLSREGRNARHLQEILERDYNEMIIDYRFNRSTVSSVTSLKGEQLSDFMQQYRPSYLFILEANDYSLIAYIKKAYQQYQANPAANRLPPLVPDKKP